MRKQIFQNYPGSIVAWSIFSGLFQFFHQMAFPVAMHGRLVFILAKGLGYLFLVDEVIGHGKHGPQLYNDVKEEKKPGKTAFHVYGKDKEVFREKKARYRLFIR
jgi:hypothetical protein